MRWQRIRRGHRRGSGPAPVLLASTLALASCNPRPDVGPVVVSAIGGTPVYADAARGALATPTRVLLDASAQGLVRFDAAGQIEAGLAERWIVIDGGMTYIFRLRAARWADGAPVTADEVVAALRHQLAADSRNTLKPFLSAIDDVVVMTPQVIEVRLVRPRPDLLKLFAQPELAIVRPRPPAGTGPMLPVRPGVLLLRPVVDTAAVDPDDPPPHRPEDDVRLMGERAALAVARFAAHRSDLVTGGTFADWPLVAAAPDLAPATVRIDPAAGLFGLAIVNRDGFLADPAHRAAIAEAIDRAAVTSALLPSWSPVEAILPDTLDSTAAPVAPAWAALSLDDRVAEARRQVAAWTGGPIALRIAMPPGPGGTLVFATIGASLANIGVAVSRVAPGEAADLALVDQVAPYDSARWYLATACRPCGDVARQAIETARDAPTLAERAIRIAIADRLMADDVAFIPIARPLRWSLVSLRLRRWQANSRAWHPLNRLRGDTM